MSGESGKDVFSRDRAELFEILGHPSRIGMLQALAKSPHGFSELKRALGIESSGQLQFHLGKMNGLVQVTPEGDYALTDQGREALRIIAAHASPDNTSPATAGKHNKRKIAIIIILLVLSIAINAELAAYAYYQNQFMLTMDDVQFLNAGITSITLSPMEEDGKYLAFDWEAYCENPTGAPLYIRLEQIAIGISVQISSMTMTGFSLTGYRLTPYGHQLWDPFTEVVRAEPYSSARINGTLYFGPLSPEHNGTQRITTLYNYLVEEGINISSMTMRVTFSNDVPFVHVEKTLSLSYAEIVLSSNR